jgi:putative N6-adenine-specific DNA methylase
VVARIAQFRALHLAQLDKRSRKVAWGEALRRDVPFRVEATCKTSRIYHSGAAAQRVERAINEELGAPLSPEAEVCVRVRFDDDMCTIGVDTSGELLHKRGFKEAVAKAPMRETMAAMLLRLCGYDGREPVLDPMCGSGTFVIEAAEVAAGLKPGRSRRFAFEQLATFDAAAWAQMRAAGAAAAVVPPVRFHGSDIDAGAIVMSRANAERAGVAQFCEFKQLAFSEISPPDGSPGLVIINPPYGDRIGEKARLTSLYRAMGQTLKARFSGWRVGIVASDEALASACGLPFLPTQVAISHGGLRVTLYQTAALPAPV